LTHAREGDGKGNENWEELNPCVKRKSTREESLGVVHREEMNMRKAQRGDGQHNRGNLNPCAERRHKGERGRGFFGRHRMGKQWLI
jgi:hypothetical protein